LRGTGVTVTTLCPGSTATKFFAVAGAESSPMARRLRHMMPADRVARLGYEGLMAGRRLVVTGTVNRLVAIASRHAPHLLTLPVTERMMAQD
jgi:short-subunit dehydrogenase